VKYKSVCFKSANDIFIDVQPFYGEIYSANETKQPVTKNLPGEIVLIGGLFSINTWTERVRTQQNIWISLYESMSCISRAGWYSVSLTL
jgi:hypothetical protein